MSTHDEQPTDPMERVASALGATVTDGNGDSSPSDGRGKSAVAEGRDDAAAGEGNRDAIPAGESVLSARDVELSIGDQRVLDGVDLRIEPGEVVVLMGPNGAGKSVFLACCAGALSHDAGVIEYFDAYGPRAARGLFSVAIQGDTADPELTGAENCRFFQQLHPAGTDDWERLAERFELGEDVDRTVAEYSGGMARKVELASALSADVPLFLLDEPASALDLSMLRILHDELLRRRDEEHASVLLTSHTPLDARIADRLVFLREGRVYADGPPGDLLDDLPPVLRVRGAVPDDERYLGDRAFGRGDEVRGFLDDESDADVIEEELPDDALVEVDPPSFTDLFNYYAYLAGAVTGASASTRDGAATDPNDETAGTATPDQ